MTWAESYDSAKEPVRSLHLHEQWIELFPCPVLRLDSSLTTEALVKEAIAAIHA